jgi:hypothetical protein
MIWPSRTGVLKVDASRRHLAYRPSSDERNPPFTI